MGQCQSAPAVPENILVKDNVKGKKGKKGKGRDRNINNNNKRRKGDESVTGSGTSATNVLEEQKLEPDTSFHFSEVDEDEDREPVNSSTAATELDPYDTPSRRYRRYGDSFDESDADTAQRLKPDDASSWCMMTNSDHSNVYYGGRSRSNSECSTTNSWAIMDTSVQSDFEYTPEDYEKERDEITQSGRHSLLVPGDMEGGELDLSTSIRESKTHTAAIDSARQELLSDVMQSLQNQYNQEQQSVSGKMVDSKKEDEAPKEPERTASPAEPQDELLVDVQSLESELDKEQDSNSPESDSPEEEDKPLKPTISSETAATEPTTASSSSLKKTFDCRDKEETLSNHTASTAQGLSVSARTDEQRMVGSDSSDAEDDDDDDQDSVAAVSRDNSKDIMSSSDLSGSERRHMEYEKDDLVQPVLPSDLLGTSTTGKSLAQASVEDLLVELAKRAGSLGDLRRAMKMSKELENLDDASVHSAWYSVTDTRAEF